MNAAQQALDLYEKIHQQFPRDMECLRYLVTICKDMGLKSDHHAMQLRKLERLEEAQQAHQAQMEAEEMAMDGEEMGMAWRPAGAPEERPRLEELPDPTPPPGPIVDSLPMPEKKPKRVIKKAKPVEEDDEDWGDIGDDLLPPL